MDLKKQKFISEYYFIYYNKGGKKMKKLTDCDCLYQTIIQERYNCMFEDYNPSDLHQVQDLNRIVGNLPDVVCGDIDEVYERLCVLGNESMIIEGVEFTKVVRVILGSGQIVDLNKIEKAVDLSVWSNCAVDVNEQTYEIYWKGHFLNTYNCPPSIYDLKAQFNRGHGIDRPEFERHRINIEMLRRLGRFFSNMGDFIYRISKREVY